MKQYIAKGNLNHNRVAYKEGDIVKDLTEEHAQVLLADGAIVEVNDAVKAEVKTQPDASAEAEKEVPSTPAETVAPEATGTQPDASANL